MKIIYSISVLLFNSIFLVAMDTPVQQSTTLSDGTLVKFIVEGNESESLELPWQQVQMSELRRMVEDMGNDVSLPFLLPAGVSLNTAKMVFTILKPYAESTLTKEKDKLKKALDPELKNLSLSKLIEVANGANLLSIDKPILERIGNRCTKLIAESPYLMLSDYQAIDAMSKDFFMTYLPIKPEPIMVEIKNLLLKKQLNYGNRVEFDVGFNPVMGKFYDETSIAVAGMADESTLQLNMYDDKGKMSSQEKYQDNKEDIVSTSSVAATKDFIAFTLPDDQIIIQQRSNEKKICRLKANTRPLYLELLFSPNDKYLVFFSRDNHNPVIYLWDIGSINWSEEEPSLDWTKVCEIKSISELARIKGIFFISDTQLLIAGREKINHQLLKATINFEKGYLECNVDEKNIIDMALSYDEKTIFSVDGKYLLDCYWDQYKQSYTVKVYDIKEKKVRVQFYLKDVKEEELISMCFNSDNTLVAFGTKNKDSAIIIYDALSGSFVHSFSGLPINNMIQFSSKDRKMMAIYASRDPYDKKINYPGLGRIAVWDIFTKDYSSAINHIGDYDYDRNKGKLTFLYRFLSFLKNKKNMVFKEGDVNQFNWLHDDLKLLLNYIKQSFQEKKPTYQPHSFQPTWQERWQQWKQNFLTPAKKAMIFYGTLTTGVTAIGYAMYKYMTSTTATKD